MTACHLPAKSSARALADRLQPWRETRFGQGPRGTAAQGTLQPQMGGRFCSPWWAWSSPSSSVAPHSRRRPLPSWRSSRRPAMQERGSTWTEAWRHAPENAKLYSWQKPAGKFC